jgi:type I restriction enzyme S subunit
MNLAKYFSGATIPHIYFKDYQKEPINIPDIDTQRKISRIFDKIDALIASRKEQRTKLDQIVKSRFIEIFGNPKLNPNSYPISQLSEHIKFLTSGSRGWAQYCVDNGSEWFITIKNVKDCRISIDNMQPINAPDNAEAKRTKVQEGDLLISITADLGRTGVVTKEIADHGAYINQHLTCIRLNKEILNPMYVAFFMESPAGKEQFESKNQSAVKAGLNFNSINSLRLLVPPLELQNQFAAFVAQTDKSKLAIEKSLDKLEILKKALMQKYFG